MRRVGAVVIGMIVGVLVAGVLASLTVALAPAPWRGERVIWAGAGAVVVLCGWAAWAMAAPRRT